MDKLQNCSCNQFFFFSYFSLLVCVFCVLLLFCLLFLFCAFLFLYLQVYRTLLSGGNQIVLSKKISIYQLYHYQYINYININISIISLSIYQLYQYQYINYININISIISISIYQLYQYQYRNTYGITHITHIN